jgi:endo-1,4-beta-xylanase
MKRLALFAALLAGFSQETKPLPPWVVPPKEKQAFLEHKTFRSESMKVDVGYNIYLPPGYAESPERRYPVIYWHHGMNCHESNDQFPAALVDQAIRDGKIQPLIVAYPNGGGRSFYCDSVDGKVLSETMIVKEFIPHVDRTYRTIAAREGRAIQGMSMGGHGCLKLAFKYPDLYSSAVAFAPGLVDEKYLAEKRPDCVREMFGGDASKFAGERPANLIRTRADAVRGKLPIMILIGKKDFLLPFNQEMHAVLEELKVPHEYVELDEIAHNLPALAKAKGLETLAFAAKRFRKD